MVCAVTRMSSVATFSHHVFMSYDLLVSEFCFIFFVEMDSESEHTIALLDAQHEYMDMNEEDAEFDEDLMEPEAENQATAATQTTAATTQATAATQATLVMEY